MIITEYQILNGIDFEILFPNMFNFFQIFAKILKINPIEMSQGFYLLNIILMDVNMLKYNWSILAFAVIKIISKKSVDVDNCIIDWIVKIKKELENK